MSRGRRLLGAFFFACGVIKHLSTETFYHASVMSGYAAADEEIFMLLPLDSNRRAYYRISGAAT